MMKKNFTQRAQLALRNKACKALPIFKSFTVLGFTALALASCGAQKANVLIDGVDVPVKVARSDSDRMLGLSGRESLSEDSGLLFVFENPGLHSIWMKDMNFPIDIIWIGLDDSKDGKLRVFDIRQNVNPDTYPTSFKPVIPSLYVLEVNSGFAENHDINIGDTVNID
ncbi:MAG: DUF192 domain-containing protein [Candidatus Peregrinibacteria bacterium]|nr:DUF192 domain-containing protein [Candidatus Peregrinibacteria bacterium]